MYGKISLSFSDDTHLPLLVSSYHLELASVFLFVNICYERLLFSISGCSLTQFFFYTGRVTYIPYEIVATIICPSDSFRTVLSFYFSSFFHGKWANCLRQNKRHFFILLCSVARTLTEIIANTFG